MIVILEWIQRESVPHDIPFKIKSLRKCGVQLFPHFSHCLKLIHFFRDVFREAVLRKAIHYRAFTGLRKIVAQIIFPVSFESRILSENSFEFGIRKFLRMKVVHGLSVILTTTAIFYFDSLYHRFHEPFPWTCSWIRCRPLRDVFTRTRVVNHSRVNRIFYQRPMKEAARGGVAGGHHCPHFLTSFEADSLVLNLNPNRWSVLFLVN